MVRVIFHEFEEGVQLVKKRALACCLLAVVLFAVCTIRLQKFICASSVSAVTAASPSLFHSGIVL